MINRIIRSLFTAAGLIIGYQATLFLIRFFAISNILGLKLEGTNTIIIHFMGAALFGFVFFILSPSLIRLGWKITTIIEGTLQTMPITDIVIS